MTTSPIRENATAKHPLHGGTKKWRNKSEDVESLRNGPRINAVTDRGGQPIPLMLNDVMT
jgi:hypothetical protein